MSIRLTKLENVEYKLRFLEASATIITPSSSNQKQNHFQCWVIRDHKRLIKPAINIISYGQAKRWYEMENEMERYFFNGVMGKEVQDQNEFLRDMWGKYGAGTSPAPDL